MKLIFRIVLVSLIVSSGLYAQKGKMHDEEMRAKFEELEKIKLIEALHMNEETTLRFFARQTEHKEEQKAIMEELKAITDELDYILKSEQPAASEDLKSKINELNDLEFQLEVNRAEFINSLSDILTYEQIAQLIIFERSFRNEVRKMLMKERRPPKNPK